MDPLNCLQVPLLEMETISHHQLAVIFFSSVEYGLAILFRHRQWLFAENMHTRIQRANGVVSMQVIRQRNIDGIDPLR